MTIDLEAVKSALEPTRKGLEAAGFTLDIAERGDGLQLTVVAGAAACEDCLVPKSMFKKMAADEISDGGLGRIDLEIAYPIDARRGRT